MQSFMILREGDDVNNQIISKWLGECRHELLLKLRIDIYDMETEGYKVGWSTKWFNWCPICGECRHYDMDEIPDYKNDPAAWSADLYNKIDATALYVLFTSILKEMTVGTSIASLTARHAMRLLRATPSQKAEALARAIKEAA